MSQHRRAMRNAARAALAGALPGRVAPRSWAQGLDGEALPLVAVLTQGGPVTRGAKDMLRREETLLVVLRRAGDDGLEDALDDDAIAAEAAVRTALDALAEVMDAELAEIRIQIAGEGGRRIGQVEQRWTCIVMTNLPE